MRGYKDYRDIHLGSNYLRCRNSIAAPLQPNIHQNQIGPAGNCQLDSLFRCVGDPGHLITQVPKVFPEVHRNQILVFNDQYFAFAAIR